MGQTLSRNDQSKRKSAKGFVSGVGGAVGEGSYSSGRGSIGKTKKSSTNPITTTNRFHEAEESAANSSQRIKQTSTWSLGSLKEFGRLNWSFTNASRSSSLNRNKNTQKSLTTSLQKQQDQLRRSKTIWHKPLTNAIFNSHFKETSRNREFFIEKLVAKGAFGVVFKVIDKSANVAREPIQTPPTKPLSPSPPTSTSTTTITTLSSKTLTNKKSSSETETQTDKKTTTTTYALKVLKKSKIIQENSVQQIKNEADIQKICGHHPFIVQQIDLWQNRRNLHILSEFIPNGELFAKISHFSLDLIRLYLAEIALALDFLHNAGIIYRDAKPENILLTTSYHIKLIDFGLSKWLKLGATTKTMCGTFQYMAPEILRGEAYGHAVDWWSLGVIVCRMMTNKGPDLTKFMQISLQNEHPNDAVDNAMNDNDFKMVKPIESHDFLPIEIETLPHESKDVLQRLLIDDPKKRIRSVMALQKIAMYKNFKIDAKQMLNIRPFDIIQRDDITLLENEDNNESSSILATKAFQDF